MLLEGTILKREPNSVGCCVELHSGRIFVEREVFEDLDSLQVGTEIEDELHNGLEHILNGMHVFQPSKEEAAQEKRGRDWRYRRTT